MINQLKHQSNHSSGHSHWLYRTLNIRTGEGRPVLLLVVFSFFIGLALSFYFTASNAIFIKHFEPRMISLAFIASGIAVYLTWLLLTLIDKRLPVTARFTIKFILVLVLVLAISIGVWLHDSDLMAFLLFTLVRVLVYISLVTFWGLAGKLFNLRQGKRIFGLIGAGEVISIIIGYFSVPLVLNFMKTPSLLFLSSAAFLACLIVVIIILRMFGEQIRSSSGEVGPAAIQDKSQWRYLTLIRKPYFLLISLMALLPIFGYLFVDYMFLHQTKYEFNNDQETIARFFGYILGFVAVVELIFKLFVSGRLLSKYGLKPSMISLPLVLLASTSLAALFGTFYGAAGMFFAFIVFSRLMERSVRGAIFEPAFQLLYQPVPAEQRLAFQGQIEGIPKAAGTILTGAVLWLFSAIPAFSLVYFNYFFLLIILFWIWVAIRMFRAYRGRINELLSDRKTDMDTTESTATASSIALISEFIEQQEPRKFSHLFPLIEGIEPVSSDKILHDMLRRFPEPLQAEVIRYIEQMQVVSAKNILLSILSSGKFKNLQPLIESALAELKLAGSYSLDLLANLAGSVDPDERELAARLLAYSPQYRTIKIISELQRDTHPAVRKAALVTSAKVKRIELWPGIIDSLSHPLCGTVAFAALKNIGVPVLDNLEELFRKAGSNKQKQILIIKLYRSIGGIGAVKHLRTKISYPDMEIRLQVLLALCRLNYKADYQETVLIRQTIENSIEIMVWIMAALSDTGDAKPYQHLSRALQQELSDKREQIFLLLSLIYDARTIKLIRDRLESGTSQAKIFALEVSDMTVSDEIKEMVLPLFDDLTLEERLELYRYRFPQQKLDRLSRLTDIIQKDYNAIGKWTKVCAIRLLSQFSVVQVMETLRANLVNPSLMISETAALELHSMDQEAFWDMLSVQRPEIKRHLETLTRKLTTESDFDKHPGITEKTESLHRTPLFSELPEHILAELVSQSQELSVISHEPVPAHTNDLGCILWVLTGHIQWTGNKQVKKSYKSHDMLFLRSGAPQGEENLLIARENTHLLNISMVHVIQLIRDYPVFARKFLAWYTKEGS